MVCVPARACTAIVNRWLGASVLAGQPLGIACCEERTVGVRWHTSVSSVKTGGLPTPSLGETDNLEKAQSSPPTTDHCYPELNQAQLGHFLAKVAKLQLRG